jgi:hypothetical protein
MRARARLFRSVVAAALVVCAAPAVAVNAAAASPEAAPAAAAAKVSAIDQMMFELAIESARDAAEIRRVYEQYLELLVLNDYSAIEGALMTGGLVPLPERPILFNLVPRLDGAHPIGEKDLGNQASYLSARASTIGALIEIASRVKSSPVEITSLVRHGEYQDALRITNSNATTSVPMHTMGLAVDIALVNTPLETAYEIRDILLDMRAAGELLFIGERQQLVFHVVPHPSRLGYFNDVYAAAVGATMATRAVEVVAPAEPRLLQVHELNPQVTTEVVSILPAEDAHWEEWFAEPVEKPVATLGVKPAPPSLSLMPVVFGLLPLLGGALTAAVLRRLR